MYNVHSNVRMDYRLCFLVVIDSDESGRKEVLLDLSQIGLSRAPHLEIGDGALLDFDIP